MVIYLPMLLIFFYLLFRLVLPARLRPGTKAAAVLLLFLASQQHLLKSLFFGNLSSPELPVPVLLVLGWFFVCLLVLFVFTLLRDMALLAKKLKERLFARKPLRRGNLSPAKRELLTRREFLARGAAVVPAAIGAKQAVMAGLIMLPTGYGVSQAITTPEIKNLEARLPRLPKALDGLVLAQISDTHVSPLFRQAWARKLVEQVNELNPDLVLITGDLVDGLPADRAESVAEFRKLRARHGVFACPGNHEYYSDYPSWMEMFAELNIDMLRNSHRLLGVNRNGQSGELVVAGLTDAVADRFALPLPDIKAALAGTPERAPRILLDHRPGNAALNAAAGIDLQLSGHTHGGQMIGMSEIVSMFNHGYVRGWYDVNGMPMYVSAGAGLWNGFPVRLGVPPEIARITLRAA